MIKNLLSIAGSDPSGGAGIQADLKSFSARQTYGMAAITALTAQSTLGVTAIHIPDPLFLKAQLDTIFADIRVDGIKIGMIANADLGSVIADCIRQNPCSTIVLDPVMIAKGGSKLLSDDAVDQIRRELMPLATVITPNLPEAAALLNVKTASSRSEMEQQARALIAMGANAVLLKGGHLEGNESPDLLACAEKTTWLEGTRQITSNTHGTGCSLSSALAAELAKGIALDKAAATAKQWLREAITANGQLTVGTGHGPVHHFHELWRSA